VALRAHHKRQLEEQMKKAGLWKDHGLVFPSTVGTPLSHGNVVRSFKALLKRAGLPRSTRLYDLCHTCATLLLNSNVHPSETHGLSVCPIASDLARGDCANRTWSTLSARAEETDPKIAAPW
jgi:integrase